MAELFVVADHGRIRSFRLRPAGDDPREKAHLDELEETALETPGSRGEIATDQSGRFAQGSSVGSGGGMSYGEEHNLESELERKTLQVLAEKIGEIVKRHGNPDWVLAAPQSILGRLKKQLPKRCQKSLAGTLGANVAKEPIAKLEKRFLAAD